MDKITPDMIIVSLVVAAAFIGFALLVWQLVDKIRAARKPHDDLARWQGEVTGKLKSDKEKIEYLEEGQGVMLRGINAIISHEINGNSIQNLKDSQKEILNYLTHKEKIA